LPQGVGTLTMRLGFPVPIQARWTNTSSRGKGGRIQLLLPSLPPLLTETRRYDRFRRNSSMKSRPASPCQRKGELRAMSEQRAASSEYERPLGREGNASSNLVSCSMKHKRFQLVMAESVCGFGVLVTSGHVLVTRQFYDGLASRYRGSPTHRRGSA
jgi:hypothetical protein